jgi:DNA-binding NtrC family response regulator
MQVKLLRLLETGTYRRVGSTELRRADIRLVSATHRPLKRMIAEGSFRQDLYFRINTFPIRVPALREREGDLAPLIEALLERVAPKRRLSLSPAAMRVLCDYPFPGNVRELRNVLERASLMCDGDIIGPEHLPEEVLDPVPDEDDMFGVAAIPSPTVQGASVDLDEIQRQAMLRAVRGHRGSRRELAQKLGISERTLYRRLRELGLLEDRGG